MKDNIHPNYRFVVVQDTSCDYKFLTKSTANTKDTIIWEDGKEYPLLKVEISSQSHNFYTGEKNNFSNVSRVEKFRQKYSKNKK